MYRWLITFVIVLCLTVMLFFTAAKVLPVLDGTLAELHKPVPDWFKIGMLAVFGVMFLVGGLMNAIRLFQGKGAYIISRVSPNRTEDKGFLGILFTLIWLGTGLLFIAMVVFRIYRDGQR